MWGVICRNRRELCLSCVLAVFTCRVGWNSWSHTGHQAIKWQLYLRSHAWPVRAKAWPKPCSTKWRDGRNMQPFSFQVATPLSWPSRLLAVMERVFSCHLGCDMPGWWLEGKEAECRVSGFTPHVSVRGRSLSHFTKSISILSGYFTRSRSE